ncbi:MAG: hypothetical protein ABI741_09935 [Ferruginibacter sp.]
MRWIFFLLFLSTGMAHAQPSDFIILKKKNKTIHSYYAGTQIEFVTITGAYRNAVITRIVNDSIFLQEFIVRQVPTQLGFYITDTSGSYRFAYHYKQIGSIGKEQKGFNISGSGAALLGGGTLLTLANGVVFLVDRKKFSPALLIASATLAVAGYLMIKAGSKGIVIGKRNFRLEYIKLTGEKNGPAQLK